jgi:hypothetical protein
MSSVPVISDAGDLCNEWDVTVSRQIKKIRSMPGENASDTGLSTQEEMDRSLRKILDKIGVEIFGRFSQLRELESRFGFLFNAESLANQLDLQNHEQFTELRNKCTHLAQQCSKYLNGLELYPDYKDIIISLKGEKQNWEKFEFFLKELLKYISSMGLEEYKTLARALQILLTFLVSVASCERSFSKMKLIKSYLLSTVSQDRFTKLSIFSIENEVASSINFSMLSKILQPLSQGKFNFKFLTSIIYEN